MTKERQALSTRAIKDTPPTEDIALSNMGAIDFSNAIAAEEQKGNAILNPEVFKDLASISNEIHKTRRAMDQDQFLIDYNQEKLDTNLWLKQQEDLAKRTSEREASEFKQMMEADILDAKLKATRTGEVGLSTTLDNTYNKYLGYIDKVSSDNPYLGGLLYSAREQSMSRHIPEAFNIDAKNEDNVAKFTVDTSFRTQTTYVAGGILPLEAGIQEMADQTFPVLFSNFGQTASSEFNTAFNTAVAARANYIATVAQSEEGDVKGGKAALMALLAEYADPRNVEAVVDPETGEKRSVTCTLDDATVKHILSTYKSLNSSDKAVKIKTSADGYEKLTKTDSYYASATFASAERDMQQPYDMAMQAYEASGDPKDLDTVNKVATIYYEDVYPRVAWTEMARDLHQQGLSAGEIKTRMQDILNSLEDAITNGFTLADVSALYGEDSVGLLLSYYGLPSAKNDQKFAQYLESQTLSPDQAGRIFLQSLVDAGKKALSDFKVESVLSLDPTYRRSKASLANMLNYGNLVTEDSKTGTVVPNAVGIAKARQSLEVYGATRSSVAGSDLTTEADLSILNGIADNMKNKTVEQQIAVYEALAQIYGDSSQKGMWINSFMGMKLDSSQSAVAKNMQTQILLTGSMELDNYRRAVEKYQIQNQFNPVSISALEQQARNKISGSTQDIQKTVQTVMTKAGIPYEQQTAVRNAVYTTLSALTSEPVFRETGKTINVKEVTENIVNSNFEKGVYKYSGVFSSGTLTPARFGEIKTHAEKVYKEAAKRSGVKDSRLEVSIDPETCQLRFLNNGEEVKGVSTYGTAMPLHVNLGSVVNRYSADTVNQGLTDYVQGVGLLLNGNNTATQETASRAASKLLKSKLEFNRRDYAMLNTRLLAEASKEETFAEYMEWKNNGYQGINIVPLAKEDMDKFLLLSNLADAVYVGADSDNASGREAQWNVDALDTNLWNGTYRRKYGEIVRFVDFLNTKMSNKKVIPMNAPVSLGYEGNGIPYTDLQAGAKQAGLRITSTTEGEHATKSLHYELRAVDMAPTGKYGSIMNSYGRVNLDKYQPIADYYTKLAKEGVIQRVLVGHSEIADKYKNVKNKEGKPLFYYPNDPKLRAEHKNHDHVEFYDQLKGLNKNNNSASPDQFMANSVFQLKKDYGAQLSPQEAKACAKYFYGFEPDAWDAENCGRSLDSLKANRYTKVSAGTNRFLTCKKYLGSSRKAIALMNGATLTLHVNGHSEDVSGLEAITKIKRHRQAGRQVTTSIKDENKSYAATMAKYSGIYNKFIGG